jgi:hypothetical protein
MTIEQMLGYARSILDSYGMTTALSVVLLISTAAFVYNRFFNKND